MQMKAMLLEQIAPIESSPLRLTEVPMPEPKAGEVRMKVRCCGVCRTDLHVVEGDLPPQKMPVIPGHQIVGTVDALGPDCVRLRLGQRIGAAWLRWTCGQCRFCTTRTREPLRVGPIHRLSGRWRLCRVRRRARGVRLRDPRPIRRRRSRSAAVCRDHRLSGD